MSIELFLDISLSLGVITLALVCLMSKDLLKAIIIFICFGLFVSLIWARLQAWDVAMAEAAIGAGITGVLLLAAWLQISKREEKESDHRREHV